jgi:putative acetyltransferase
MVEAHIIVASSQEIEAIQSLWREYWDSLGLPHDFQGFSEEVKTLPGLYAPPRGRLLLAFVRGKAAGTAALRPLSMYSCEAKRLYVRPKYRGEGVGRSLLRRLVEEARTAGYQEMYGDTLKSMTAALKMYRQVGFSEVAPYSSNPTPGAIFLKLSFSGAR